jgi:transcriptional regulator with XRE-family HTH domain
MTKNKVWKCRRQALGYTQQQVANLAGCDLETVRAYENDEWIDYESCKQIQSVIYDAFKDMDSVEHYKKRILEIALKLNMEDDKDYAMNDISHMIIELGKLQREMIGLFDKDYRK